MLLKPLEGGDGIDILTGSHLNDVGVSIESDTLTGGNNADIFVLSSMTTNKVFYFDPIKDNLPGNFFQLDSYATITDFDRIEGDKIQGTSDSVNWSFLPFEGGTMISYDDNWIAHIENITDISLNDFLKLKID